MIKQAKCCGCPGCQCLECRLRKERIRRLEDKAERVAPRRYFEADDGFSSEEWLPEDYYQPEENDE